jgi:FkbM family methyltransferase
MDDRLVMHWLRLEDLLAKTISYAQNYEDILLARLFPGSDGTYIDVGANHPVFHSVTKLFSDRGWSGINIEPSPGVFPVLEAARPRDINLNVGLSDREGSLTFYETPEFHGWSTFHQELADHYRQHGVKILEHAVPVTTLAQVCERHVVGPIDFLKIDVEGLEGPVLDGADFTRFRPRVLVIENFNPATWEGRIDQAGYLYANFDGLNRFYVRSEESQLAENLKTLVNVLDNFIPYEHTRVIDELRAEIEAWRDASRRWIVMKLLDRKAPRLARRLRRAVRLLRRKAS